MFIFLGALIHWVFVQIILSISILLLCCLQMFVSEERSSVWGKPQVTLPPYYAAFVNGVAVS